VKRRRYPLFLYIFFLFVQIENSVDDITANFKNAEGLFHSFSYFTEDTKDTGSGVLHGNARMQTEGYNNAEVCADAYNAACYQLRIHLTSAFQTHSHSDTSVHFINDHPINGRAPPFSIL
jgi:hypothetical protein